MEVTIRYAKYKLAKKKRQALSRLQRLVKVHARPQCNGIPLRRHAGVQPLHSEVSVHAQRVPPRRHTRRLMSGAVEHELADTAAKDFLR